MIIVTGERCTLQFYEDVRCVEIAVALTLYSGYEYIKGYLT